MTEVPTNPLFTADLPGIGGVTKADPEAFVVEEIEAYSPCGEGDHVFLWVEKTDVSAGRMVDIVARSFSVSRDDVGTAGNKDRRAVTRQWVSVPAPPEGELSPGDLGDGVRILRAVRHGNKLRTNHLRGNRFVMEVRDLNVPIPEAVIRTQAILDVLFERGTPNFFGEQRFGREGSTLRMGLALLSGETPGRLRRDRKLKRLAASAVQSAIFNEVLRSRMADQTTHRALVGDRLNRTTERGQLLMTTENLAEGQAGLDNGTLAVTGPMIGPKMYDVTDEALTVEEAALQHFSLKREQFHALRKLTPGTRRDLFARFVEAPSVEATDDGVRIGFSLPSGAYATVVLAEITKSDFYAREAP